ncbi:hypothetical protein M9Y10_010337 [Tritrichomonas musculus]|uniref:DUF4440 domain-containing protein n=1 Tax=Tritrichomonas musculus TaxID=1915356 RepID=A0ABR2ILR9_9EUKA
MSIEESKLAEHVISLEKAALDKWFKGDTSGYLELWSKNNFSYFDGSFPTRVDDYPTIKDFVLQNVENKLFADKYEFKNPRVQFGKDMALLTYQLFSKTNLIDMKYNCIQLYQKEESGDWKVIHSTWSFIRPMDMDFGGAKTTV